MADVDPWLPVEIERTDDHVLSVDGAIPPVLEGMYVRNGPDAYLRGETPWLAGDAMVHAIELRDGMAISYRNRWVRSKRLATLTGTRPPPGPQEPFERPPNANVVWHGGRLLALGAHALAHRLTTGLETAAVDDFDGMLGRPVAPHPRIDPDTGGMAMLGTDLYGPPFLSVYEADAKGSIVHASELELDRPSLGLDWGVSGSHIVLIDPPAVFDRDLLASGEPSPFRWDPDGVTRVGIIDRGAPGESMDWTTIDPCYVRHVVNAFDDGDEVVMDVCRLDRMEEPAPDDSPREPRIEPGTLERWRVSRTSVTATVLDDLPVELPRVDPAVSGRPYRYAYCVEMPFRALVRYDLVRNEAVRWEPGPTLAPGEVTFVRDPDGRSDDEGWILSLVYDVERDGTDLVIIDGSAFGRRPDAVVHLPARVPFGLHGNWVPASSYR